MRQKILTFCFCIYVASAFSIAGAQTVEVQSMSEFSTKNPPKTISIKLIDPLCYSQDISLSGNTVLTGKLVDIKKPRRLKKNATFSFEPTSYSDGNEDNKTLDSDIVAKYYVPLDKANLAKKATLTAANTIIPGFSIGYSAISGAIKDEDGNVIKSSAKEVYNNSPLSLFKKGEHITIKSNELFLLKFPDITNVTEDKKE